MNWKKLEALYTEAFKTGNKERCSQYIHLILDELQMKQCSLDQFNGGNQHEQ